MDSGAWRCQDARLKPMHVMLQIERSNHAGGPQILCRTEPERTRHPRHPAGPRVGSSAVVLQRGAGDPSVQEDRHLGAIRTGTVSRSGGRSPGAHILFTNSRGSSLHAMVLEGFALVLGCPEGVLNRLHTLGELTPWHSS